MNSKQNLVFRAAMVFLVCSVAGLNGCKRIHGRPGPDPEVPRPEQVLSFDVLYKQNCAACHGENGQHGASLALNNPVYLAVAREENLRNVIAKGAPSTLMPPFAIGSGGTLTDQQVGILTRGMVERWSTPAISLQTPPPYRSELQGDAQRGHQAFASFCSRCHGASGEGGSIPEMPAAGKVGSIVDPAYLALMSDQGLRSIVIAGRSDEGMPDWRSDGAQAMTDQQITDILSWLASQRVADPGQPYRSHP
ncbi:c-type cytochrome [Granulicella sp. WH15]|uniref:c-type cytochrome n=1 Tax=Granulicella sp. WH15 TaxID=2602070 RepID=UPI0013673EC9|nr:c-type cytochrome [Granulicella sp. WH15]QHN03643.1 c-type cytochrome [Granulicella sp. WH15]